MKVHCFDPKLANQVGMAAAVIFYHISFWIDHNAKNEQNFRDGRYWTYNSVKAFSLQFPYLTPKQIRTALDKLVTSRLIMKAEHNADRSDRTTWYALGDAICPEGQADLPGEANEGVAPQGSSKENRYKPDKEPPSRAEAREETDPNFDKVWHAYPADRRRNWAASRDAARAAIDRGEVSLEELQSAAAAYATESSGYTRSKVSYSDNWFGGRRWQRYVDRHRVDRAGAAAKSQAALAGFAEWVISRSELCRNISRSQGIAMQEAGLVTFGQLRAAGVNI